MSAGAGKGVSVEEAMLMQSWLLGVEEPVRVCGSVKKGTVCICVCVCELGMVHVWECGEGDGGACVCVCVCVNWGWCVCGGV